MLFKNKEQLWDYALSCAGDRSGVYLEFGVYRGKSINYFSKRRPKNNFFGFDSFEGLAKDWPGHHAQKGTFDLGGALPEVFKNVTLVKGWFDETIPKFLSNNSLEDIVFVHIDGDTYESSIIILNALRGYLKHGVLIFI